MKIPTHIFWLCALSVCLISNARANCPDCQQSWVFQPSNYTHDPQTGARVAQYVRKPPVEPLDDPRNVTSRYRRTRTNIRGADGSLDTHYQVQAWGNGRGGIDAEWERFHNAWQSSSLTGSYNGGGYGSGYPGYGSPGYGGPGYGFPGGGFPGYGFPGYVNPPGYGYGPGYGAPGHFTGRGHRQHDRRRAKED